MVGRSAEQGYAFAQAALADMYLAGLGVKRDDYAAANWFQRAAEQGNAEAENKLGILYLKGIGLVEDDSMAASLVFQGSGTRSAIPKQIWLRSTKQGAESPAISLMLICGVSYPLGTNKIPICGT